MSYLDVNSGHVVANASESERKTFYQRTYMHLAGAILAFTLLESFLLSLGLGEAMMAMLSQSKWTWLVVLGLFMVVSYFADKWAHSEVSRGMQYFGLGVFIVAEAIVFLPMIYMALNYAPGVLPQAAVMTLALVAGLTFTAFTTKANFSFLGPVLTIGGFIAMGVILASIIFGFQLGIIFFGIMILFAAAAILYQTSNIIHEYGTHQYVGASLGLFSSVGLLFWYILQFLMALGGD